MLPSAHLKLCELEDKEIFENSDITKKAKQPRNLRHDLDGSSGARMGSSLRKTQKEDELDKSLADQIEMQDHSSLESLGTQDHVERLAQKIVNVVASVESLREMVQTSNETNQSLSEQVADLENSVEGLKTAAENGNQGSAKLLQLEQQVSTIRKTVVESSDSLISQFQEQSDNVLGLIKLVNEQSVKSQAHEEKLNLLSAQLAAQTERADEMEASNTRLQQESLGHRHKQAEQDIAKFDKFKETLEAAEKCARASESISVLSERMNKLETKTINTHEYDSLTQRLLLLESKKASADEFRELSDTIDCLIQSNNGNTETANFNSNDFADSLGSLTKQVIEQSSQLQMLSVKMELLQSTVDREIFTRSQTANVPDISELSHRTVFHKNQLNIHHCAIVSLQNEAMHGAAASKELANKLEMFAKGLLHHSLTPKLKVQCIENDHGRQLRNCPAFVMPS